MYSYTFASLLLSRLVFLSRLCVPRLNGELCMLSFAYLWCSSSILRCCLFQYHELLGIAYLHQAYIGHALRHGLARALLCCVLLYCSAYLAHDEISFDLRSLDRLVSTRFCLLLVLAGWLLSRLIGEFGVIGLLYISAWGWRFLRLCGVLGCDVAWAWLCFGRLCVARWWSRFY